MKGAIEHTELGWRKATDTTRHHRERKWDYKGQALVDYVHDNPRRLWLKRANPDLFRIHQHTAKAGNLPHDSLRYRFLALNIIAALLAPSRE